MAQYSVGSDYQLPPIGLNQANPGNYQLAPEQVQYQPPAMIELTDISADPQAIEHDLVLQQLLYRQLDNKRHWQDFNRLLSRLFRDPYYNIHYHEDELLRKAAAVADDYRILEVILEKGADPNALAGDALLSTIQRNRPRLFKTLLEFGGEVLPHHMTALVTPNQAIANIKHSALAVFIEALDPTQVAIPNSDTRVVVRNLLKQAISLGNIAASDYLHEILQEPYNTRDIEALFTEAYFNKDYPAMLNLLKRPVAGLDRNRLDSLVLGLAVQDRAANQIAIIAAAGVSVSMQNEAALQTAIQLNYPDVVRALLNQGADKDNAAVRATLAKVNNPLLTDLIENYAPAECAICLNKCGPEASPSHAETKTCRNNHAICRTCYQEWRNTTEAANRGINVNVPCPTCRTNFQLSPR